MTQTVAASAMPPSDPATVAAAHRQLLADGSIQFQMSGFTPPHIPDWLRWLVRFLASPGAKYLLWGLLVVVGCGLLYVLARWLFGAGWPWARRTQSADAEEETWQPEAGIARALLRDADALADEGRFSEAVHLLLFRSIEDIDARRPQLVRPALTSRDIAGAPDIPHGPRSAFATIVMMVERSLFGGRTLAEGDWRNARACYEQFAFAEAWR